MSSFFFLDSHGERALRESPSSLRNCGTTSIRKGELLTTARALAIAGHCESTETNSSDGYRVSHSCESEAAR